MAGERLPFTRKCRCGAVSLLTATGVRYEENAGAICRHRVESCDWFAPSAVPAPPQAEPAPQGREGACPVCHGAGKIDLTPEKFVHGNWSHCNACGGTGRAGRGERHGE